MRKLSLSQLRKIQQCALALVDQLKVVHDDPLYQTVWSSAQNHGINYKNGPTYRDELINLRKALGKPK